MATPTPCPTLPQPTFDAAKERTKDAKDKKDKKDAKDKRAIRNRWRRRYLKGRK
jgi:hypothetical protein